MEKNRTICWQKVKQQITWMKYSVIYEILGDKFFANSPFMLLYNYVMSLVLLFIFHYILFFFLRFLFSCWGRRKTLAIYWSKCNKYEINIEIKIILKRFTLWNIWNFPYFLISNNKHFLIKIISLSAIKYNGYFVYIDHIHWLFNKTDSN